MRVTARQYGRGFTVRVNGRRARRLSTQGTRFIYVTRDVVVKVAACRYCCCPVPRRHSLCPFNVTQNRREARRLRAHGGPHLPRLLASDPDHHWIAVTRLRHMRDAPDVPRATYAVIDRLARKLGLLDVSMGHNWAMHRGTPVLYDLGV